MEKREKRNTTEWLNAAPHGPKKHINYDISNQGIKKESFNYGVVPFGSHSKQQFLYQSRMTHTLPASPQPGPGSYGVALSPRDDTNVMGRNLSPGYSFSKIGLSSDGTKTRQIHFQAESMTARKPSQTKMGSRNARQSFTHNATTVPTMNSGNSISNMNSLRSLGYPRHSNAHMMQNIDSNMSLLVRPMQSDLHTKSPSQAQLGFGMMIKDQSVTKLGDHPLITDRAQSMEKIPTIAQALAGVPISPSNNTINSFMQNQQTQASSVQIKSGLSSKKQSHSLKPSPSNRSSLPPRSQANQKLEMELGTMGIPRDVAHFQQQSNFLWTSGCKKGPGDYEPNLEKVQPRAREAGFGTISSPNNYKSYTTLWEEKMEKYIGVKPSERDRRPPPKKDLVNGPPSWSEQQREKPSFMFQSMSERQVIDRDTSNPGPQDYLVSAQHLDRKNFKRPMIVATKPTRNTDGAISVNPNIAAGQLKHLQISPGPPSLDGPKKEVRDRTQPRMRQYGLNMITNTLQDPGQIKMTNMVMKEQLKKRLTIESVPGPGEYETAKPIGANRAKSMVSASVTEEQRHLSKLGIQEKLNIKQSMAFNSTQPRFKDGFDQSNANIRNRTFNGEDITKPVYELQMLEGPQIKAKNKLLNAAEMPDMRTINGKTNTMGLGVFRSDKVEAAFGTKVESSYLQRAQLGRAPTNLKAMTSQAELSIMNSQLMIQHEKQYKDQMMQIMRQEDHMVVFNSSSPRFQDTATHQIRVVPGKDSVTGINFRVKNDKPIGPGAYASPDEIEHRQKIRLNLRHNRPESLAFGASAHRAQHNYVADALKSKAYQGKAGEHHTESTMVKPTFNHNLKQSPSQKRTSLSPTRVD